MINRLFVYGTLAPGRPNEHMLSHLKGRWQEGWVLGSLIEDGWGADLGYPGIIPDPDAMPVHGWVLSSRQLPAEWAKLDAFEGPAYTRQVVDVYYKNQPSNQAYIYALKTSTEG